MIQKSHLQVYIQRKWKQDLEKIAAPRGQRSSIPGAQTGATAGLTSAGVEEKVR